MNLNKLLFVFVGMGLTANVGWGAVAVAKIQGTAEGSKISGLVKFEDTKEGLKISAQIDNAPAGNHGFHIHEFGDCGDSGKNAGGHYNPMSSQHGQILKDGSHHAHLGDMGNITIAENGSGAVEMVIPKVTLTDSKFTVGGRGVILHEKADDFGQPVGNAGGRIGCGVITITK
jgi:Cu-Zn family superoxide dismutase